VLSFGAEYYVFKRLSTNMNMEIYSTTVLPVILYGCETWSQHSGRTQAGNVPEQKTGENSIIRSFMICNPHQILFRLTNKKNKMGRACGTYEEEERCTQNFGGETE